MKQLPFDDEIYQTNFIGPLFNPPERAKLGAVGSDDKQAPASSPELKSEQPGVPKSKPRKHKKS